MSVLEMYLAETCKKLKEGELEKSLSMAMITVNEIDSGDYETDEILRAQRNLFQILGVIGRFLGQIDEEEKMPWEQ